MIYLGLDNQEKQKVLKQFLTDHPDINKVFIFYPGKFPTELNGHGIETEKTEWKEIIMYRTFYPMVEKIDKNSLVIADELMRTKNRYELTYNCMKHFFNQCGHRLVFQYLPFIDELDDFMILADMADQIEFVGRRFNGAFAKLPFSDAVIDVLPVKAVNRSFKFETIDIALNKAQQKEYADEVKTLFDNLGSKEPETVPRQLENFVGKYKRTHVDSGCRYLVRNKRYVIDGANILKDVIPNGFYIVFDFPHSTILWNDFLYTTKQNVIPAFVTDTSVDKQYLDKYNALSARLEEFYAKTSVY